MGLLDVPRAARTQPIQTEPTICPQTRPSSGNPYFGDPHVHLPAYQSQNAGVNGDSSLSPTALHLQTWLDTATTGEFFKIWMSGPVPRDSHLMVVGNCLGTGIFIFNSPGDCHVQPSLRTTVPQQGHFQRTVNPPSLIIPLQQAFIFPCLD